MKQIRTLMTAVLCCTLLGLASCKMNISQWFPNEDPDPRYSVKAMGGIVVEVSPSDTDTLEVQCVDELRPFIKAELKDSTYLVTWDWEKVKELYGDDERFMGNNNVSINKETITLSGIPFKNEQTCVKLGLKKIRGFYVASSGRISYRGKGTADRLSLGANSGGQIDLLDCLNAQSLDVECSSSGKIYGQIEVVGSAGLELSSGARIDMTLKAKDVKVEVSSGANAELTLEAEKAFFEMSSGSMANVSGSANELNLELSSGASFKGKGFRYEHINKEISSGGSARFVD